MQISPWQRSFEKVERVSRNDLELRVQMYAYTCKELYILRTFTQMVAIMTTETGLK